MFIFTSCQLLAGTDYIKASKFLTFTGESVQSVSIQIINDGADESLKFFGLLSSADGAITPNVRLEPTRAIATIINKNGMYLVYAETVL